VLATRRAGAVLAATLALCAGAGAPAAGDTGEPVPAANVAEPAPAVYTAEPAPALSTAEPPPSAGTPTAGEAWVATVIAPTDARSQPSVRAPRLVQVPASTPWDTPTKLLVLRAAQDAEGAEWLLVRLEERPNGREAWIYADDAEVGADPWRVDVSRAQRRMRIYEHGTLRREFPVVVGKPSTPTPTGLFAIAAELMQPDPNEFLGAWVMPLTAHSNVLQSFEGGDGQIALHGRGGESLKDPLGSARSHGCVRLANESIGWIALHVPVGTPVLIS